jgi:hypothetical protein
VFRCRLQVSPADKAGYVRAVGLFGSKSQPKLLPVNMDPAAGAQEISVALPQFKGTLTSIGIGSDDWNVMSVDWIRFERPDGSVIRSWEF